MIEIDIILGSKYESPRREEMICTSGAQVLTVVKSRNSPRDQCMECSAAIR